MSRCFHAFVQVENICYAFLVVGGISFTVSLGEMTLMNISATRQIRRIRLLYFRSLMRQDVGFFDMSTAGDMASRLAEYALCALVSASNV